MQVLFTACIAVVVSNSVEGLTGIPIVSTLMMLWITMGIVVVAGGLAGEYSLDAVALADVAAEPAPVAPAKGTAASNRGPMHMVPAK